LDPVFATVGLEFDIERRGSREVPSELVPIATVSGHGVDEINQTFLVEALRLRAERE
jgi:hypothetical protein